MNKGQKLLRKAKGLIPGGNQLLSKRSELFLPDQWPSYFSKYKIDLVFLTGDRFEILPVALNCLFKNIPLIHLHGGELTYGAVDDSIR